MLCLVLADTLVILSSSFLGVALWSLFNPSITMANYFHLGGTVALFLLGYLAMGLYHPAGIGPVDELRRSVTATALVSLTLTASAFFGKEVGTYSRGALLCTAALAAVAVPSVRAILRLFCASQDWWGVPVAILGAGPSAAAIISNLKASPELGFKPVACLDDDTGGRTECAGIPILGSLDAAPEFSHSFAVRHAIVALSGDDRFRLAAVMADHCSTFRHVIAIPDLAGIASLWVTPRDFAGVLGLEVHQNLLVPFNRFIKRAMDISVSLAALLVSLPLITLAVIATKTSSRGPAFFFQRRTGLDSAPILVPKLRTMFIDAEPRLQSYLSSSAAALQEWNRYCKLSNDPRIIPGLGRLLRRSSLDELPQFWCVLKGEMSLVGPRPLPTYHLDKFDPEFRKLRAKVRPGLTGLWQVSTRSDGDLDVQKEFDTYYIRNWSPWLDLHILARTVVVVLTGKGAR
ncbi:MAG: undecaprenyl-phosphate galactose phosphotransferase WbaP [Acidobacteriia bacterium]|nr:undecaprenyl-phosphate galactose phosphotransferase WbaP [Terriglobia bacterium]